MDNIVIIFTKLMSKLSKEKPQQYNENRYININNKTNTNYNDVADNYSVDSPSVLSFPRTLA